MSKFVKNTSADSEINLRSKQATSIDLGKRLFDDFNKAFANIGDSLVEEVGTIPSFMKDDELNKNPIHVEGTCIGVEQWCSKYLYLYAYEEFIKHATGTTASCNPDDLNALTRCVLLFCADCATAWNLRKKLLSQIVSDNMMENKETLVELHLTKLVLRRHPKSTETFAHRRWMLNRCFNKDFPEQWHHVFCQHKFICSDCNKLNIRLDRNSTSCLDDTEAMWLKLADEIKLCSDAASWHPSNYNAWSHRIWLLHNFVVHPFITTVADFNTNKITSCFRKTYSFIQTEICSVMDWLELHVSDHSPTSYLQEIICIATLLTAVVDLGLCSCNDNYNVTIPTEIGRSCKDLKEMWNKLLLQSQELLVLYDGTHEALWMYRRGLIQKFYQVFRVLWPISDAENDATVNLEYYSYKFEEEFCRKFFIKDVSRKFSLRHMDYLKKWMFLCTIEDRKS